MVQVTIKHAKKKYDVDIDEHAPVEQLHAQLYALTNVPPERQKIMGIKGGPLKPDTNLAERNIAPNQTLMLVGSADAVPEAPKTHTVFLEDLPAAEANARASDKPGGLSNLGNTCYLNSGIQVLKAIPEVPAALTKYSAAAGPRGPNPTTEERAVLLGMRDLFGELQISTSATEVHPFKFVGAFRTAFPLFAQQAEGGRGYVQQDAEECWSTLVNTLSQYMMLTNGGEPSDLSVTPAPTIARTRSLKHNLGDLLFGVEMECKYKCLEADEAVEPAHTAHEAVRKISCHISDKTAHLYTAVEQSLTETIEKNAPNLGRMANFQKSCAIARLPPYLVVNFVRFAWRNDTQKRAKILRSISFPDVLDVYNMCTPEVQAAISAVKAELEKERDAAAGVAPMDGAPAAADSSSATPVPDEAPPAAEPAEPPTEFDCKTGRYELFGIITHQGRTADGGHYVAWVKRDAKTWLVFDDETVAEVAADRIKELYGGGDWHMAYLCLYRKMDKLSLD